MARNDQETLLDIARRRRQVDQERDNYTKKYGPQIGGLLFEYANANPGTETEIEKRDLLALMVVRAIQTGDEAVGFNAVKALMVAGEIKLKKAIEHNNRQIY